MAWETLAWLFAVAVTLHNVEEAVFLPRWSRHAGRWHLPVGAAEFRFAVAVLALLAYVCAWLSVTGSRIGTYVLCGYALAMFLNVFIPHLAATAALRRYAPGTATALAFNLPVTSLLLAGAVEQRRIDLAIFAWAGPLTVGGIMLSIPALFMIGRALSRAGSAVATRPAAPDRPR